MALKSYFKTSVALLRFAKSSEEHANVNALSCFCPQDRAGFAGFCARWRSKGMQDKCMPNTKRGRAASEIDVKCGTEILRYMLGL
ncbi:uncharacterized protein MEPE_02655 [Melanopsichium pennsylvanicum]|uniref:Uncharacterized protein n=1 Tax=Melanopsichium pennsylvanicum TaxID=63383 RepID=A0AAJ4XKG7_9BASI|nr:uncharacterized protein MEPE_02655 [Melanopsichium pennsylvanicum]